MVYVIKRKILAQLTHLLVFLDSVSLLGKRLQPPLLVLSLLAAQHTHKLQSGGVAQAQSIPQVQAQVRVPTVRHIQHFGVIHIELSAVVQQVSAQDVFFTEDQLMVKQKEASLLYFALSYDSSEFTRVDQV